MILDSKTTWLDGLKASLLSSSRPLFEAADLPSKVGSWVGERSKSKADLKIDVARLESENLILRGKQQKLTALAIENVRLRELLNATSYFEENVLVAEIISVSPDVTSHHVVLNKGSKNGLYIGQAVIDAYGLFGQVIEVGESIARVLLISDARHSVPVQVDRNGLRFTIDGMNDYTQLKLPHVALTTDLVEGDVLSTSGLGQLFPTGYPVARVASITHSEGEHFSMVTVVPFAKLNQSRHVLLLFSERRQQIINIEAALKKVEFAKEQANGLLEEASGDDFRENGSGDKDEKINEEKSEEQGALEPEAALKEGESGQ